MATLLTLLYVVVDRLDLEPGPHGPAVPPFLALRPPPYWSLRRTPQEAIARWSWSRANAHERLVHCYLLTYALTAHGLGHATWGHQTLREVHWSNGDLDGLRLYSRNLEADYQENGLSMLRLQNVEPANNVPGADEHIEIE